MHTPFSAHGRCLILCLHLGRLSSRWPLEEGRRVTLGVRSWMLHTSVRAMIYDQGPRRGCNRVLCMMSCQHVVAACEMPRPPRKLAPCASQQRECVIFRQCLICANKSKEYIYWAYRATTYAHTPSACPLHPGATLQSPHACRHLRSANPMVPSATLWST